MLPTDTIMTASGQKSENGGGFAAFAAKPQTPDDDSDIITADDRHTKIAFWMRKPSTYNFLSVGIACLNVSIQAVSSPWIDDEFGDQAHIIDINNGVLPKLNCCEWDKLATASATQKQS